VAVDEEIGRVAPVIEQLVRRGLGPVSVDTRKAAVARAALAAGAAVVNDVSGLAFDVALAGVVSAAGAGMILMHMRGTPARWTRSPCTSTWRRRWRRSWVRRRPGRRQGA